MGATTATGAAADPAAYAIGGRAPRAVARPTSREQVAEILREATRDGLAVVPWGAGSALALEPGPARYDLALDLSGLDRLVEYDPEDFTVTAECGATIASLRAALAARGQELPLEAPHAGRATLGGVLAADASGPRRLRFGAPHDRILGARFVLADGTLVRSGGKVVKNVAGYATHRLLCGSRGALAVMVEASLKLAPAPGVRVALCYPADALLLSDPARWPAFPRLEPSVLSVIERSCSPQLPGAAGASYAVVVGFEDDAPRVDEQTRAAIAALGEPAARLEGADAAALWQVLADGEESPQRLSFTTAANTPSGLAPLLARGATPPLLFHALAGRLHLFPASESAQEWVEFAAAHGFRLISARGLGELRPALVAHPGLALLRGRIRAAFDPRGTLALGEAWASGVR